MTEALDGIASWERGKLFNKIYLCSSNACSNIQIDKVKDSVFLIKNMCIFTASVAKAVDAISEALGEIERHTCLQFKKRKQETGYILFANRDPKRFVY